MPTRGSSDVASARPLHVRFGGFELDEADARLTNGGQPVALAPKPFTVLCALARTPQALVSKNALLDIVWGHRFVSESVLKTTVSELRAALRDDPRQPRYIETVSRRGYRFIGTVTERAAASLVTTPRVAPPSSATSPAVQAIGRANVFEHLCAAWRLAVEGERQIVWISGEAGVGKTTLVERFMTEVGEPHCAHGQCVEQHAAGEPYLPVLEALTALCRRDAQLVELIRAVAPAWLLQLPWLSSAEEREALRRELAGAGQARMLREMGELLDRYTAHRPLLLVTEDLHWSDHATVQLIDYIARRRTSNRLLWLASFRVTEIIAADHPLRAVRHELRLHRLSTELVLDPFSETEVAEYLAARVPALAADETLVHALYDRTDGLPLFVADLVNDLIAEEEPADGESSLRARLAATVIPETLSGIVERYIEQLAPRERMVLEAASACGIEFRLVTLTHVLEDDAVSLAEVCADLARRQRWLRDVQLAQQRGSADAGYLFRHALYREVMYKRIGRLARVDLHRRVAAALERERTEGGNVTAAELASHFDLGGAPMQALHYYAEAAESALLQFSPAQTIGLAERAFALVPATDASAPRTALELTLSTLRATAAIQLHGIGSSEARSALEHALALLDAVPGHPLRALPLSALGLVTYLQGDVGEAMAIAGRSEALSVENEDLIARVCACVVYGLVEHSFGRPRTARAWLEQGVAASETLDATMSKAVFVADPGVLLLGTLAIQLLILGCVDQGRGRLRAAQERALFLDSPLPKMAALWFEALFEVRMDNPERVAEAAERMRAHCEEYGLREGMAAQLYFRGWAQAHLGDARAAYRLICEGYEESISLGIRADAAETLGYAAEALMLAGDWTAARQKTEEAMRCAEANRERKYLPRLLLLDGRISQLCGERERSRASMRRAVAEARAQEAVWFQLTALSALCEEENAPEHVESLRLVVDQLKEGLDSPQVARAQALIENARRLSKRMSSSARSKVAAPCGSQAPVASFGAA